MCCEPKVDPASSTELAIASTPHTPGLARPWECTAGRQKVHDARCTLTDSAVRVMVSLGADFAEKMSNCLTKALCLKPGVDFFFEKSYLVDFEDGIRLRRAASKTFAE